MDNEEVGKMARMQDTTREMNRGHGELHNTMPRAVLRWIFSLRFVLLRAPRICTRAGAVNTCVASFEVREDIWVAGSQNYPV